jgi:hypothetical protein
MKKMNIFKGISIASAIFILIAVDVALGKNKEPRHIMVLKNFNNLGTPVKTSEVQLASKDQQGEMIMINKQIQELKKIKMISDLVVLLKKVKDADEKKKNSCSLYCKFLKLFNQTSVHEMLANPFKRF